MPEDNLPELSISEEKLCFIIAKAREFDVKDVVTDPDDASNATDDAMLSVLEDHKDDPVVQELAAVIFAMSEDEQVDLVALTWLGRGDGTLADWSELRAEPRAPTIGVPPTTCWEYLCCPITWRKPSPNSAFPATRNSDAGPFSAFSLSPAPPRLQRAAPRPLSAPIRETIAFPSPAAGTLG